MRTIPATLQAKLDAGVTTLCRCWRMTLRDGRVLGFTDHDRDVVFDGLVHHGAAGLSSTADVARTGFSVGGLEISGAFTSEHIVAEDLAHGVYDGARVDLWVVDWSAPEDRVLLRRGTIGEVVRRDGAFRAEVRGPMQALSTVRGRIFGPTCDADLGDARCRALVEDLPFRVEGTVSAVGSGRRLRIDALSDYAAGWFTHGTLRFAAGANHGRTFAIKVHTLEAGGSFLDLREGPRWPVEVGEGVVVVAGCDKRFETCREKFGNAVNFRGFPHIPGNDVALAYARRGDSNDGGPVTR